MKKFIFGLIAVVIIIVLIVLLAPSSSGSAAKTFMDQMQSEFMAKNKISSASKEISFPRTESDQGLSNIRVLNGYVFTYEGAPVFNEYMKSILGTSPEWLNSVWQKGFMNDSVLCLQSNATNGPNGTKLMAEVFCADLAQLGKK